MAMPSLFVEFFATPADELKEFKRAGGFTGTAISPYYLVKRLTEKFGMVGIGWNIHTSEHEYVHTIKGEILVFTQVCIWYLDPETQTRCIVGPQCGGDVVAKLDKEGNIRIDDEALKKAQTDAFSKCCSYLGLGGDVHDGMLDSKYTATKPWDVNPNDSKKAVTAPTPKPQAPAPTPKPVAPEAPPAPAKPQEPVKEPEDMKTKEIDAFITGFEPGESPSLNGLLQKYRTAYENAGGDYGQMLSNALGILYIIIRMNGKSKVESASTVIDMRDKAMADHGKVTVPEYVDENFVKPYLKAYDAAKATKAAANAHPLAGSVSSFKGNLKIAEAEMDLEKLKVVYSQGANLITKLIGDPTDPATQAASDKVIAEIKLEAQKMYATNKKATTEEKWASLCGLMADRMDKLAVA